MPRRFHRKSKNGCDQCKERRVKCDETRPKCSPCSARELPCIYSKAGAQKSVADVSQKPSKPAEPANSPFISQRFNARHLLLMHKFSTDTFKTLCGDNSDMEDWQNLIPKLACDHEFLLNGIFAIAALHSVATTPDLEQEQVLSYLDIALQCNEFAFAPFREALAYLTPANCDAVFAQSSILAVISMALPRLNAQHRGEPFSMIETMIIVSELLQGANRVSQISKSWRQASIFFKYNWEENTTIEPDIATAIEQLQIINRSIESTDSTQHQVNLEAIEHLQNSLTKYNHKPHPAPILAWPAFVRREFVDGLRNRQPFQLLILMHWGVLLKELGTLFWWAQGCGEALVVESLSELKDKEKWKSAMQWPKQKLGL